MNKTISSEKSAFGRKDALEVLNCLQFLSSLYELYRQIFA